MSEPIQYDVIIVGGSYAGLSAAMSLGRSLRKVLIIDSGQPCNKPTPHAHNFITHDGEAPATIAAAAKQDVLKYEAVSFQQGKVSAVSKSNNRFEVATENGLYFTAKKILFATGIKDIMPTLPGFEECWGKSVVHCPYCHGYEGRGKNTGILFKGQMFFDIVKMVRNLTPDITIFTDGKSTLPEEQRKLLEEKEIPVIETPIVRLAYSNGILQHVVLEDGNKIPLELMYARPDFVQHGDLPEKLGCETENGLLKVDMFQKTTVAGIFAAGDNSIPGRALALSVAAGNLAGAMINKELCVEEF